MQANVQTSLKQLSTEMTTHISNNNSSNDNNNINILKNIDNTHTQTHDLLRSGSTTIGTNISGSNLNLNDTNNFIISNLVNPTLTPTVDTDTENDKEIESIQIDGMSGMYNEKNINMFNPQIGPIIEQNDNSAHSGTGTHTITHSISTHNFEQNWFIKHKNNYGNIKYVSKYFIFSLLFCIVLTSILFITSLTSNFIPYIVAYVTDLILLMYVHCM